MSSRIALALSFVALAAASATGFAACSSSDTTGTASTDAGSDATRPSTPKSDGGGGGGDAGGEPTRDECIAACESKHAAGLAKDKAIDTCWSQSCKGPCIDGNGMFDAGIPDAGDDAGDAAAAGDGGAGQCKNGVETGDDACNDCTSAFCCGAWDGCFDDQDCAALNECRSACPEQ